MGIASTEISHKDAAEALGIARQRAAEAVREAAEYLPELVGAWVEQPPARRRRARADNLAAMVARRLKIAGRLASHPRTAAAMRDLIEDTARTLLREQTPATRSTR